MQTMSSPTIAIIGASKERSKYGNKSVRAHVRAGYTVYPVNPKADEIEGLQAYASVEEIPGEVEIASLYLPPSLSVTVLEGLARKGIKQVFFNPGSESPEGREKAEALGMQAIEGCSIIAAGMDTAEF